MNPIGQDNLLSPQALCQCRRKSYGQLDLFPTRDTYHPMSEYPTYHTHGRYVPPASTKRSPYEEVKCVPQVGAATWTGWGLLKGYLGNRRSSRGVSSRRPSTVGNGGRILGVRQKRLLGRLQKKKKRLPYPISQKSLAVCTICADSDAQR